MFIEFLLLLYQAKDLHNENGYEYAADGSCIECVVSRRADPSQAGYNGNNARGWDGKPCQSFFG
ncbi:MAG: hypothetical protein KA419_07525 [Acidobacteria bacterium]|nr:hypothetical protein [Acidobacteriota bacterium]